MKLKSQRALQIFLAAVLLLMSCDISTFAAPQQIPTPIPGAINLIVAQTAAAAATQTAAIVPPTLTPTLTPFPTWTPLDTSTVTPTFVFLLPTSTPTNTPVSTPTSQGIGFACNLINQSPKDDASLNPNQAFKLTWKIKNVGSRTWNQNNISLNYTDGDKFTDTTVVFLPNSISIGSSIALTISMTAPGKSGGYTTNWALEASSQTFCTLFLRIIVK